MIAILLVVPLAAASFYPVFTVRKTFHVDRVIDGDTIDVSGNGSSYRVRLKGVDTPETKAYNTPGEFGMKDSDWRCLENWGYRAENYTRKMVGERVVLRYRKTLFGVERGYYGRMLAYVYPANSSKMLDRLLVKNGYARSYGERFIDLEKTARKHDVGLWGCGNR